VAPAAPVQATVTGGTIETVALSNAEGKAVAGELSADKRTWSATEPLGYDKAYTWSGKAVGADGKDLPIGGSFRTVKPKRLINGQLNVGDGATYGVAMPIVINFSSPVADRVAVEKALKVETSVPTEGGWGWLDDSTVHWRSKEYFAANTKVTVSAKLYGLAFGNGAYGKSDVGSTFTIGRAQIAKGNTQTHRFVVIRDGQQIADYPASYGLDSDPGRVTKSGTHIVMAKSAVYFMTNPQYDYENIKVQWAVRISNNGEFTHGAPWSTNAQGKRNVSHGCVNLSTANAKAYFDSALPGDPVEIIGSTQPLSARDGDYHDWIYSWEQWRAKSALPS
jgi:lipoprotein-anchoring transpeptidase ErfK/SrfK